MAVIVIATCNDKFQKQTPAVAKKIGKVDHGNNSYKTPGAAACIGKVTEPKKRAL
jgi:hypothetical protein